MKHRINFAIEQELIDAAKEYAKRQYISVTDLVRQYFLQLKRELEALESQSSSFERSEQPKAQRMRQASVRNEHDSTQTNKPETQ